MYKIIVLTLFLFLPLFQVQSIVYANANVEELIEKISQLPDTEKRQIIEAINKQLPPALEKTTTAKDEEESWFSKIKVRKSSYDKNQFSDPAMISLTDPNGADNSYAIDFGISFLPEEWSGPKYIISPMIEYHKNNTIEKEQDVLRAGISGSYLFGALTNYSEGNVSASLALSADGNLDIKRDHVKDTKSWEAAALFRPLYTPWGLGSTIGNKNFRIGFDIQAGSQFEDVFSGGDDKDGATVDGDTLRLTALTGVHVYPAIGAIKKRLELSAMYQYWNEVTQSGIFDDNNDDFDLFKTYILYYLDDKLQYGLTLSYQDGDDPSEGLLDQSFVRLGLIIKLGK